MANRNILFALSLFIFFISSLKAQDSKPGWVKAYEAGFTKELDSTNQSYMGIGVSAESQEVADLNARKEFAAMNSTSIRSKLEQTLKETDSGLESKTISTNETQIAATLKGVMIKEKYFDNAAGKYYSIIVYDKNEYNKLLLDELKREQILELEKKRFEAQSQKERDSIERVQKETDLRHQNDMAALKEQEKNQQLIAERRDLETREKEDELAKETLEKNLIRYRDFLESDAPSEAVNFHNAVVNSGSLLELKLGVLPFQASSGYFSFGLGIFELSTKAVFADGRHEQQEAALKIQLLGNKGRYNKTSIAFGIVAYTDSIAHKNIKDAELKYSPLFCGNFALPDLAYSYASFYGDLRKISLGINNYALFPHFKDALSFIGELSYYFEKRYSPYGDSFLFEAGIRFRQSESFESSITFENHRELVLAVGVYL